MADEKKPEHQVFDNDTVAAEVTRVLSSLGRPTSTGDLSQLLDIPEAVVSAICRDMASEGELFLDDDGRYALLAPTTSEADEAEVLADSENLGDVSLQFHYDDTSDLPPILEEPVNTVLLPTSDLLRFLTTINLPPQLVAGLGALSDIKGFLSYEVVEATPDDPCPVRRFHVHVYGHHTGHLAARNPNQSSSTQDGVSMVSWELS